MDQESETDTSQVLPDGYRAALVTAITVFLGFSLYFLRFWGLENPGQWTGRGAFAAAVVVIGIVVQLVALFRSLDIRDNDRTRYSVTVKIFFGGVLIVVGGVITAIIVAAS